MEPLPPAPSGRRQPHARVPHTGCPHGLSGECHHAFRKVHTSPPLSSFFHMPYLFERDGTCQGFYLAPSDAHHFREGRWRVASQEKDVIQRKASRRTCTVSWNSPRTCCASNRLSSRSRFEQTLKRHNQVAGRFPTPHTANRSAQSITPSIPSQGETCAQRGRRDTGAGESK